MSVWKTLTDKIKGIINKMIGRQNIEEVLKVKPSISSAMITAIELWTAMYENRAPWIKGPTPEDKSVVKSLGLSQLIASEKARTALIEFESEITTPIKEIKPATPNYMAENNIGTDGKPEPQVATHVVTEDIPKGPTDRADYLNKQYTKLKDALRVQIEYGIAKGGLVIKPIPIEHKIPKKYPDVNATSDTLYKTDTISNWEFDFDYIQANEFYPLSFDASGKMTEAAFIQRKYDKDKIYSRLEYHRLEDNVVTVINKAFETSSRSSVGDEILGKEVPLDTVPEWAMLSPETKIGGVNRLLFAYFKMPEANTIDTHSPLGVSGFDKVKSLIEEADKQYSRLLWEFEGGELAIDIDREALRFVEDPQNPDGGHSVMSQLQDRLFRKIDLNDEKTYEVSPQH